MSSSSNEQGQTNYVRICAALLLIILIPLTFYDDLSSPTSSSTASISGLDQTLSANQEQEDIPRPPTTTALSETVLTEEVNASSVASLWRRRQFYNNSKAAGIPNLIVSGPPKTGTSTLMVILGAFPDVFAYPMEHFFFASFKHNELKCAPKLSQSEWTDFTAKYLDGNASLSSLVSAKMMGADKCSVDRLRRSYGRITKRRRSYKRPEGEAPKQCINPLDGDPVAEDSMMCWFVEKAPVYSRRPFVPMLVANRLPLTRYLTIIRNPVRRSLKPSVFTLSF